MPCRLEVEEGLRIFFYNFFSSLKKTAWLWSAAFFTTFAHCARAHEAMPGAHRHVHVQQRLKGKKRGTTATTTTTRRPKSPRPGGNPTKPGFTR